MKNSNSKLRLNWFFLKWTKFTFGFTLVELIVVITILAILGTIGFISIQGYSSSARDSSRISNLVNLQKWLTLFQVVGWTFPMPESPISVFASGTLFAYQWFARDQVTNIAKLSAGTSRDPLDPSIFTTYTVNAIQTKMQLMAFLEDGSKVTAMLNPLSGMYQAHAATSTSYATRTPMTKGDSIGILIGTGSNLNQPVQELLNATFTGIDIVWTSTDYTMYMNKTQQFSGTGVVLKAAIAGDGLVGYWSFDEGVGTVAYDRSGNENTGTLSWSTLPTWTVGKLWKSLSFSGWYITIPSSPTLDNVTHVTVSAWVNSTSWSDTDRKWIFIHGLSYYLTVNPDGFVCIYAYGKNPEWYHCDTTSLPLNSWQQLTMTTNNIGFKLYINGQLRLSKASFGKMKFASERSSIGSEWSENGRYFNWLIDEVRIYNRALSDSEIQTLYNATK